MTTLKVMKDHQQDIGFCYMLGVLAEGELHYPGNGVRNEAVSITPNGNSIIFHIKPVSPELEVITEIEYNMGNDYLYIGFDQQSLRNVLPPRYMSMSNPDKEDTVKNLLKGKLVLFQPTIQSNNNIVYKNLTVVSIEEAYKTGTHYTPVPVVTLKKEEFEQILQNQETLELLDYNHLNPSPQYMICEDSFYVFSKGWKKNTSRKTDWIQTEWQDIKKTKLNHPELINKKIYATDHLCFFENTYLEHIKQTKLFEQLIQIKEENMNKMENPTKILPNSSFSSLELHFLDRLEEEAKRRKLSYKPEDIRNFHVSVKTNLVTILSGMSGTGKTQLAMLYANALGLHTHTKKKTLLIVPISPSYTEPGDILGYLNTTNGLYMPSETGLVDFLIEASKNKDQMYFVLFDECNLSQVEYWFSPFISLLELPEEERYLQLYSNYAMCHNQEKYPASVKIGDNLKFIGTANMDETTKSFSDRLLDRTNVVTPQKMTFIERKGYLQSSLNDVQNDGLGKEIFGQRDQYLSWLIKDDVSNVLEDHELRFFDGLHKIIHDVDPHKGVSFRVLDRICSYLCNIPKNDKDQLLFDREDALDIQVMQRILTKVRGPIEQYEELIGTLSPQEKEPKNSKLFDHISSPEAKKISHFTRSREVILRKAKELLTNGYTS
jgi:hypothetical protein